MTMEIIQDLTCPVCLELYTHPIILSCGHVLCRTPCARNILELNVLRCPVCRASCYVHEGLSSLPRVISLESIIGKFKAVKQKTRVKTDEGIRPEVNETHLHESRDEFISSRLLERGVSCQGENAETFRQLSPQFLYVLTLLHNARAEIPVSAETHCQSEEMVVSGKVSTLLSSPIDAFSNTTARAEFHSQLSLYSSLGVSESGISNETHTEPWERCIIPPSRPITKYDLLLQSWKLFPLTAADASCEHDGYDNISMSLVPWKSPDTAADFPTAATFTPGQRPGDFIGAAVSRDDCYLNCLSDLLALQPSITKHDVEDQIDKLMNLRHKLLSCKTSVDLETKELQKILQSRCEVISSEIDTLVSEIESLTTNVIDIWEEQTITQQTDVDWRELESQEDRPLGNLRQEQRAVRVPTNQVPEKPLVDISMCARNSHTVVLAIAKPTAFGVIDYYEVLFGTKEQKHLRMEETLVSQWSPELLGGHSFVIIENLCKSTHYFISVSAVNKWGRGPNSDVIHCSTLDLMDADLTAPVIVESLSYASNDSATIVIPPSPPLEEITPGLHETRFTMYRREADHGKAYAWSGIRLLGGFSRTEVVGLTADTEYQFRVMSCDHDGRCELSEKLMLRTCSS